MEKKYEVIIEGETNFRMEFDCREDAEVEAAYWRSENPGAIVTIREL